ncbi:MAG TPA: RluA family pseudouridine synthase [Acholeplasmataceae bacterium]|jgi:23S rRNA pseudouridine1911/1915/1917 synthase|nr:RluA family pseudouridine synthase [Acholeplasmataceae bacterium]
MTDNLVFQNVFGITVRMFLESFYISKKLIYKLEQAKAVFVNQKLANFNYVLEKEDILVIYLDEFEEELTMTYDNPLTIIYEDEDLLLVRKPPGILVHPDGKDFQTLDNMVAHYYREIGLKRTARHAYRLDYDTGGLLLYTKHFLAAAHINYQIENNKMRKIYYAVVEGKMKNSQGVIDLKIGKNRHLNNRYLVSESGKRAITKYKVLKSSETRSLLEVEIETGRRHQIRVHLKHLGHPLVGDAYYGKKGKRLLLEAFYLSFYHPRMQELMKFALPLPPEFKVTGE